MKDWIIPISAVYWQAVLFPSKKGDEIKKEARNNRKAAYSNLVGLASGHAAIDQRRGNLGEEHGDQDHADESEIAP